MSRLLLVRHGDTELNSGERYWGRTDVKLSAAGLRQAEQLRHRLATERIDAAYSSDLKRAALTAGTIAPGHQLATCPELREIDFGQLEGLTFDQVRQLHPEVARLWQERSPRLKYPGGESLDEFKQRVSSFLSRLAKHAEEETILIVAHSGSLRLLVCQLLGLELKHWWQIRLALASLTVIETYSQGAILSLLNDTCHLAEAD
jgi:alpha-ribazole phosphatase